MEGQERNLRKVRTGEVVSTKMDKTIVVRVSEVKKHPIYKKAIHYSKKFKVHDENSEANVGDSVQIMETRHISKDKYFRLVKIVEKAK